MNTNHRNQILPGDCISLMPTLAAESVDFILTDPPYLVNYASRDNRTVLNDRDPSWLAPGFRGNASRSQTRRILP